jgi:hypothetical protein
MKPTLTIAELAELATFGANKLKKAALENTALSAIIAYDIIKGGKVLRVETVIPAIVWFIGSSCQSAAYKTRTSRKLMFE